MLLIVARAFLEINMFMMRWLDPSPIVGPDFQTLRPSPSHK